MAEWHKWWAVIFGIGSILFGAGGLVYMLMQQGREINALKTTLYGNGQTGIVHRIDVIETEHRIRMGQPHLGGEVR